MGLDKFLDNTVWKAGRGAKKVNETVEKVTGAPKRAVKKAADRVTPKCVGNGGSMRCQGNGKNGKGTCKHGCGNKVI